MSILKSLVLLAFGTSVAMTGCVFGDEDDEGDVDPCVTTCEDEHEQCVIDCDDDTCVADCDTVQDDCETECG